ncbi:unnamed protein product [Staurois parvus]|uniref:Uncharacterized protein n=1 Tax=Staurois parvus TaxID=386267 RepID=A0ABN9BQV7_9NEOB|nr:unnamed protein product [Staurois parvus]
MEVLARYCSIPGYNKLCCESCSKRSTQSPPFLTEAAETEDELSFDPSASRAGMIPTSLSSDNEETESEARSLLTILSSIESNADLGLVSPTENRAKTSDPALRRSQLAASKTFKLVAVPPSAATHNSNIHTHKSSGAAMPLAAGANSSSTGAHSSVKTLKRNDKPQEKRRSLQSSSIER